MIKNFVSQAANERTFLSWVRTAVTVMAFGFLIEKLDLTFQHLSYAGKLAFAYPVSGNVRLVSLGLLLAGVGIIVAATWRFFRNKWLLDADALYPVSLKRHNLWLALLMVAGGGVALGYIALHFG
ncbi:MAG: hypothetical protein BWK73_10270 [Thiothrix lacustris]|uniref:DUF202 domain-containing protein n=1 Tax=Thiothrix lacustris TaxID=525917 RepID=A0A1Y1QV04_9GAMM|nr:MAG: hypothetical protein BWK73_10270 [Thiothrix lacustris]